MSIPPILDLPPITATEDLSWLPTPLELSEAIESAYDSWPEAAQSYFEGLAVPPHSLCATPASAHIALLGMAQGAHFTHHELRGHIPLPNTLAPSQQVWEDEGTVPIWKDGILHAPKYFSFFLESPLPPYHPNHRSKWRVHELLHTWVGFFWHPQLTRFEAYIGARLSELLPIVHWYGLDEIGRLRCPKHIGKRLYRTLCPDCEALVQPFWTQPPFDEKLRTAALEHATHALDHFSREFEACLQEIQTGQVHETPRPNLDAASDAQGYLIGHWNRLTAWSFGSWVLQFCVDGVDYHSSLPQFAQHVAECFRGMLMGASSYSPAGAARQRLRQSVLDIGYRAYCVLEWVQDEEAERTILGCLEDLAQTAHGLLDGTAEPSDAEMAIQMLDAAMASLESLLPEGVVQRYLAHGHVALSREEAGERGYAFVVEGLQNGLPDMLSQIEGWESVVGDFIAAPDFMAPKALRSRFADWLRVNDVFPAEISTAVQIEAWLRDIPHKDEEARLFASMPSQESWGDGTLRCHETLRRQTFSAAGVQLIFGWELEADTLALCCVWTDGSPQVFVESEEMTAVFAQVKAGEKPEQDDTVLDLLDIGALVWLPKPNAR